ncbi:hypothetical protein NKG94_00275 [Micromonospora sp. M12]
MWFLAQTLSERATPTGGGAGLSRPIDPDTAGGRRGSRRDSPAPGRCRPARRCVMTAPMSGVVVVTPPGVRVAMVNAAATSRCPTNPQLLHIMVRPRA